MIRSTVAKWSTEVLEPKVKEMDQMNKTDQGILKGLFEQGFMGIPIPSQYGGAGMNLMAAVIAIEELAKVDAGISASMDVHTLVTTTIFRNANEEQKQKYLPKLCNEWMGSFCLSESGSGSDAFALKAKAV